MRNKIINIPNFLCLIRGAVLTPFMAYYFIQNDIVMGMVFSGIAIFTDLIDGPIARASGKLYKSGKVIDVFADNMYMATLVFTFLYLGFMNWQMVLFMVAHRFTRGSLALRVGYATKGFYTPIHIKATGTIPMVYVIVIPIFVLWLGQKTTDIISWSVFISTYIALLISIIVAMIKLKKGTLKTTST